MIKNVIVIIPARGGSKRLPNKNMVKIWGKPMIYWAINASKNSKYVKSIYVTSNSNKILDYAKSLKVKLIKRPETLSDDKTEKMKAIMHATKEIKKKCKPTIIVSLQANSPDVKSFDIDKCIEKLIRFNLNEVISTDENFNQNGTIRALREKQVFFDSLSTHCGFIVTNTSDIHTIEDLKKQKDLKAMQTNKSQRNVKIISEIHPQFLGSTNEIKRVILQSKIGGSDYVKVQLYNSKKLFNNQDREYLEISKNELKDIKKFSEDHGIELTASIFDEERLDWCEDLNFSLYKIASRTLNEDKKLCEKIISTNKETIISLGMYDISKGAPYLEKNIKYLYCVSKYPTALTEIRYAKF